MSTVTQALVRAPFRPLEVTEGWDVQLLQEAAKLIGYRPKALAEAERTRKRSLDETILARALETAGIEPFTVKSVQAYKAQMLREAHKGESWHLTRYMHQSGSSYTMKKGQTVAHAVGWPSCLITAGAFLVSAICHWSGYETWGWDIVNHKSVMVKEYMSLSTAGHVMTIPLLAVGVWAWLMYLRHKPAHAVLASWNIHKVDDSTEFHSDGYKDAIPAFAVQRMISLKKELPEVTFAVEQLNATRQDLRTEYEKPLPPDPFLVATFRGISCYIDVWDEPKFEGRRTV